MYSTLPDYIPYLFSYGHPPSPAWMIYTYSRKWGQLPYLLHHHHRIIAPDCSLERPAPLPSVLEASTTNCSLLRIVVRFWHIFIHPPLHVTQQQAVQLGLPRVCGWWCWSQSSFVVFFDAFFPKGGVFQRESRGYTGGCQPMIMATSFKVEKLTATGGDYSTYDVRYRVHTTTATAWSRVDIMIRGMRSWYRLVGVLSYTTQGAARHGHNMITTWSSPYCGALTPAARRRFNGW